VRSGSAEIGHPLDQASCRVLAGAIGDTPETTIAVHLLLRGMCWAYAAGQPAQFEGAIVQARNLPTEPMGFGSDPFVLGQLLRSVQGWDCILVDTACAEPLGQIIERRMDTGVRYLDDVYHVLDQPVTRYRDSAVRLLDLRDLPTLARAEPELRSGGWEDLRDLLSEGFIACAIVSGAIVATALTTARSKRHSDVGVYTHPDYRGRGLATAAASMVIERVQKSGQVPVWSAGAHNSASLRVAQKLGFVEVSRRTYMILERDG
jgi:GNAT superfamily N-acetyltransferase